MNKLSKINYKILLITLLFIVSMTGLAGAQYYPQGYDEYYSQIYGNNQNYNDYNNNNYEQSIILENFQYVTASQKESQWCWAACITMVLNYYDIPCTQEEVVTKTYGDLVNYPARDMYQIAQYLNGWGKTRYGEDVVIQAETYEYAPFDGIINELNSGKPFIIGVGDNYSGHVVVCYGVDWIETSDGPYVTNFYVYDPWPGNGNNVWSTEELNQYWVGAIAIEVQMAYN